MLSHIVPPALVYCFAFDSQPNAAVGAHSVLHLPPGPFALCDAFPHLRPPSVPYKFTKCSVLAKFTYTDPQLRSSYKNFSRPSHGLWLLVPTFCVAFRPLLQLFSNFVFFLSITPCSSPYYCEFINICNFCFSNFWPPSPPIPTFLALYPHIRTLSAPSPTPLHTVLRGGLSHTPGLSRVPTHAHAALSVLFWRTLVCPCLCPPAQSNAIGCKSFFKLSIARPAPTTYIFNYLHLQQKSSTTNTTSPTLATHSHITHLSFRLSTSTALDLISKFTVLF